MHMPCVWIMKISGMPNVWCFDDYVGTLLEQYFIGFRVHLILYVCGWHEHVSIKKQTRIVICFLRFCDWLSNNLIWNWLNIIWGSCRNFHILLWISYLFVYICMVSHIYGNFVAEIWKFDRVTIQVLKYKDCCWNYTMHIINDVLAWSSMNFFQRWPYTFC